jgi:hypothetical protein
MPRITVHGTRKTCATLLAALDVHPRIAMRILRHSKTIGSAEQRRLSEMSVVLWTDMVSQMNTDGVGGVTYEEFQAAIEQYLGIDPAGYAAQVQPVAGAYFNPADSDSDGEISQEEFAKLFSAVARIPETEVAATFSAIRAGARKDVPGPAPRGDGGVLLRHRPPSSSQPPVRPPLKKDPRPG